MKIKNREFDFENKTYTMGILNLTPDSFSDGGNYNEVDEAIKRAKVMVEQGADIIDVGAESTRPGANYVEVEEELKRLLPIVTRLVKEVDAPISIDTYKAKVAKECLKAGAHIINDIKGLKGDPEMAKVVASYNVPVMVMHIKGTPKTMQLNPSYDNVIKEIKQSLEESIGLAIDAGISKDKIILDPGIGFGKTFEHNLEIVNSVSKFKEMGYPILIGASRKGFIGQMLDSAPVLERLEGNLAVAVISSREGASIIRVHEVKETAKVLKIVNTLNEAR